MTSGRTATRRLHITGLVQGVGFRPFVYREAITRGLRGWVRNSTAGVEILVQGPPPDINDFIQALRHQAPPASRIDTLSEIRDQDEHRLAGFSIRTSDQTGNAEAGLLPDLATCPECLREMRDPANRRFRYPFINCTHCGPRYSILLRLPYDRPNTTMRLFTMCPECRREYEDPLDRRFHAQPNACPSCGPSVALWDKLGRTLAKGDEALLEAAEHLRRGGIVAVKGIGGFHLLCDATDEAAVQALRVRKHRAEKPFAVMMADADMAAIHAHVTAGERAVLVSSAAPILLVRKREPDARETLARSLAPGQSGLGIMLPYTPLHHLLMDEVKRPLVATSGNLSEEPICTSEHEALARLGGIADYFLIHNRPIAHPVDDSVARMALGRPLRLRVARGWAPLTLPRPEGTGDEPALAVGPHMKSTLALATAHTYVVSPHIGDLESVPAWESFERNLEALQGIYDTPPSMLIACDQHPDYASTRYAQRRAGQPLAVQHHHAHVLAVMAEHGVDTPVLGVALDGNGYGSDGSIWGGEVLRVDRSGFHRAARLRTFLLAGGDAAAREPRRCALGMLAEIGLHSGTAATEGFTSAEHRVLLSMLARRTHTVPTSSAGRLFDAVAALLGLCRQSGFEGQAAMLVQAEAERATDDAGTYPVALRGSDPVVIDWEPCLRGVLADREAGRPVPDIARSFHQWLADAVAAVADLNPGLPVVLGGGCFQNVLLLELVVSSLRSRGRMVYWAHRLPPNDGAISAGQLLAAGWRDTR